MTDSLETLPDDILINEILPTMKLQQLGALCQGDARIRSLCNNDQMWQKRVRIEYEDAVQDKPIGRTWRNYYRALLKTVSIPVVYEDDYIGHVRVDPQNVLPTVNKLIQKLNIKYNEILSFVFLKRLVPLSIYYYPEGEFKKTNYVMLANVGNVPDRLYIKEGKIFIGGITETDIFPYICIRPDQALVIGANPPKQCQATNRYTLLGAMYELKIPIISESGEGNLLSQFPERFRQLLSKEPIEKLRYYLGWKRYTITQICVILRSFLEKTGRVF